MNYPLNPKTAVIARTLRTTMPDGRVLEEPVTVREPLTRPVVLVDDPATGRKVELVPRDLLEPLTSARRETRTSP